MFLPFSRTMISASSCACVSTRLWNLNIIAALALMVSPLQPSNAAFATITASATSWAVDKGTSAIVSPVEGETTATLPVAEPCTNSPPMKFGSIDIFHELMLNTERQGLELQIECEETFQKIWRVGVMDRAVTGTGIRDASNFSAHIQNTKLEVLCSLYGQRSRNWELSSREKDGSFGGLFVLYVQ
jgi:hypothetical protein